MLIQTRIINKIARPSWYIGIVMLLWGMVSTLSGNVTSFGGMVAIRFCIGFVEAAPHSIQMVHPEGTHQA
jgi:hypothetical protein